MSTTQKEHKSLIKIPNQVVWDFFGFQDVSPNESTRDLFAAIKDPRNHSIIHICVLEASLKLFANMVSIAIEKLSLHLGLLVGRYVISRGRDIFGENYLATKWE
ncbi:hypothetical protein CEXT_543381 [Caerostris extrusa]|uniref:Uncharacterized protein n=1 Tax=Caerostris extrusa TaxID=172846 RepID=A0AAV4VQ80_CAEEX|nr:hypothetical protein CEXT_543381 [Caerostris extrusa]